MFYFECNMINLVYGVHPVRFLFKNNPKKILRIFILYKFKDLRLKELVCHMEKYNVNIQERNRRWMNCKVNGALHQGIIAEIIESTCLKEIDLTYFLTRSDIIPFILVLDGITDPHNLGACLRSADAAGVHVVIVPKNRSARVNSTVRKVSSGSADRVPLMQVTNISRTLKLLQQYNIWVVGAVVQSVNRVIFDVKLVKPIALVMGSESLGIRNLTKKNCNELINIPMLQSDISLNVSVATGICLFEVLRQRLYQKNDIKNISNSNNIIMKGV